MSEPLLSGKRGLIVGLANERSLAYAIAQAATQAGAQLVLSYASERLARRACPLAEALGAKACLSCDVQDDAALDALLANSVQALGGLDFVVHAVAFADTEALAGPLSAVSRAAFAQAMDVSVYSLLSLAGRAKTHLAPGGSLLTLTYYGAEKVVPAYGLMGPVKAALESAVRYLACELGPAGIRVNALSAGPVRTLSSSALPGFKALLSAAPSAIPLRRNVAPTEIGQTAVFLLSDAASAITAETLHVDGGLNALALPTLEPR